MAGEGKLEGRIRSGLMLEDDGYYGKTYKWPAKRNSLDCLRVHYMPDGPFLSVAGDRQIAKQH